MTSISTFFVAGKAEPKGSMKAFVIGGRACVTHSSSKTMPWQNEVACAARGAKLRKVMKPRGVGVSMTFVLPRPDSHTTPKGVLRKGYPVGASRMPDLDKLVRTVLDGMKDIAYEDDAQVTELRDVFKRYADTHEKVGVQVQIWGRE